MLTLSLDSVADYLSEIYGASVKIKSILPIRGDGLTELKGFGYGIPYSIRFETNGQVKHLVLETLRPEGFGHDSFADRAAVLLWQHSVFNKLPSHVRSVDVGAFTSDSEKLKSIGNCCEFFILTEFAEGELYHVDLDRLVGKKRLTELDRRRCLALSDYLARIHATKNRKESSLYIRRVRDLIGQGEGIFGLTDSYPLGLKYADEHFMVGIEKDCVEWRWKLKHRKNRLSQVHGDFHPWNIMFRKGIDFTVLDRSRGEWGEPADDLAALTINYLFYSLQAFDEISGGFSELFELFWDNYLGKTGDNDILSVIQPFYAWRSLVIASPIWYPNLPIVARKKILTFTENVLNADRFDYRKPMRYFG